MSRRSWLLLVAAVVLLVGALMDPSVWEGSGEPTISVDSVRGQVTAEIDGVRTAASSGMALGPGDVLRTGAGAEAVLWQDGEAPVTLSGRTTVRVEELQDRELSLELQRGRMRVKALGTGAGIRVRARGARLRARQADFTVALADDGTLGAEVQAGVVEVEGVEGVTEVREGQRMIAAAGHAELFDVPLEALLVVEWPEVRAGVPARVVGRAEPWARVEVEGGESTRADATGAFAIDVRVPEGATEVAVVAYDALGDAHRAVASVVAATAPNEPPTFKMDFGGAQR